MKSSKTDSLNVLFLSSWYPTQTHPTLGNFVQRHAQAIAKRHHVTVLHANHFSGAKTPMDTKENVNGVFEWITYFSKGFVNRRKRLIAWKKLFLTYLDEGHPLPDIVHLNVLYPAGQVAMWLKDTFKIPYIVTEHWTGFHKEHQTRLRFGQRKTMLKTAQNVALICPVSKHLQVAMEKWGIHGNYKVVPNVVDTELFTLNKDLSRKQILHVSHLGDDHKNVSGMMTALRPIMDEFLDWTLRIVGDGDIQPYKKLAKQLNWPENRFEILDAQPLSKIADAMKSCSIFTLFSNYENLPCVIIEAFSAGKPVVSTDVGGISEIMHEERGRLVPKGNSGAYQNAMREVMQRDWNEKSIRDYAVAQFSEDEIANQFTEIYQQVIRQKP